MLTHVEPQSSSARRPAQALCAYVCALLSLCSPSEALAAPRCEPQAEGVQKVSETFSEPYWRHPAWLAALRYQPKGQGEWESEVLSPSFFLNPRGARQPQEEWLRSMALLERALMGGRETHAAWRFVCERPDRFVVMGALLNQGEDITERLVARCRLLEPRVDLAFWRDLGALGVGWLIAGPTFEHPASVLGHASLTFKSAHELEYALSFGAHLLDLLDPLIALFGFAEGAWSLEPALAFEWGYRALEERDVVRLPLRFSPLERRLLGLHLKSIETQAFSYSFFTNNCATQSLKLLRVPRALALAFEPQRQKKYTPVEVPWLVSPRGAPQLERERLSLSLEREASLKPSRARELSVMTGRLHRRARAWLERWVKVSDQLIEADNTETQRLAEGQLKTLSASLWPARLWRAALLSLDVRAPHLLSTPPQEGDQDSPRARAWGVRQLILQRLAQAIELPLSAQEAHIEQTAEREVTRALLSEPLLLSASLSMLSAPQADQGISSRGAWSGAWRVSLWREELSSPRWSHHEPLSLRGPSLTGEGWRLKGLELMSMLSLRALNAPSPHLSWRLSLGVGEASDLESLLPLALNAHHTGLMWGWLALSAGGAQQLPSLRAQAWLHLEGRAWCAERACALLPNLILGARGELSERVGWALHASAHSPQLTQALNPLHSDPSQLSKVTSAFGGALSWALIERLRLISEVSLIEPLAPSWRFSVGLRY